MFPVRLKNLFIRPFDQLPLQGIGAEIGVYRGEHAAALLRRHPKVTLLFCVDPYKDYDAKQCDNLWHAGLKAERNLLPFSGRYYFLKSTAQDAKLPKLDFAYIDGDHEYPCPKQDMETVWPLVKAGGVMGGHDFHPSWPGVIKAVTEFAVKHSLTLVVHQPDWWFYKPFPAKH